MPKPRTKQQLEARVAQLEFKVRADAKEMESMRNELFDLRWQLGLTHQPARDADDVPFEPNGNMGAPGYVMDMLAKLKAGQSKKRDRHA